MRTNKHDYDDELAFTAVVSFLCMLVLVIAGSINDCTVNDGQDEYIKAERKKAMFISIEEYKHRFDAYKNVDKSTVNTYNIMPQVFR